MQRDHLDSSFQAPTYLTIYDDLRERQAGRSARRTTWLQKLAVGLVLSMGLALLLALLWTTTGALPYPAPAQNQTLSADEREDPGWWPAGSEDFFARL